MATPVKALSIFSILKKCFNVGFKAGMELEEEISAQVTTVYVCVCAFVFYLANSYAINVTGTK